ncbi:PREDICTED: uncharacterized protein LOC109170738 [Ipomoea nil]|uniref:uncharacterized protein LOC109170738 n=1 Tax=Ipomoea nil TaxID=35883 RepID=UPI0009014AAE|nr:PREDICTED: uncharacterized protein LOC109170738 [Ipomoea nil]
MPVIISPEADPVEEVEMVQETPLEDIPGDGEQAPVDEHATRETQPVPAGSEHHRAQPEIRRTYAESLDGWIEPGQCLDVDSPDQERVHAELVAEENDDPLCPKIRLTKEEVEMIRAPWRKSLIIKVMGRRVGYAYMLRRLTAMWKPKGGMDLIALENDYYLVRFGSFEDLEFAMYEGPWMVIGHYLIVKPWEPDFEPMNDTTEKVLVWARIPCIPMEYYDIIFLRKLGNRIGRTVRVDRATSLGSRGRFARICVEIDMRKPIISKFNYEGKVRYVVYEGIHLVCFSCGVYGHAKETCLKLCKAGDDQNDGIAVEEMDQAEALNSAFARTTATIAKETSDPTISFGAWMLAPQRRGRPATAGSDKNTRKPATRGETTRGRGGLMTRTSRFAALRTEDEEEDLDAIALVQPEICADNMRDTTNAANRDENANPPPRKNPVSGNRGNSHRRPNVIAQEKQIMNTPAPPQGLKLNEHITASGSRRETGGTSRWAAEEEEHVVVRGEQGGLVIQTARVCAGDAGDHIPSPVWQSSKEHHSDPPELLDDEGDVGAGGKAFLRALKNLLNIYRPGILSLFEPKVSGAQANEICKKLGFSDWIRVEAVGFNGGIWVFWKDPVEENNQPPWLIASVYGSPTHHLRRRLWKDLRHSERNIAGPWLAAGDFNAVISRDETSNYSSFSAHRSSDFTSWIQEEGLIDLGFSGPNLTWVKNVCNGIPKGARLDRALCNTDWKLRFPGAVLLT